MVPNHYERKQASDDLIRQLGGAGLHPAWILAGIPGVLATVFLSSWLGLMRTPWPLSGQFEEDARDGLFKDVWTDGVLADVVFVAGSLLVIGLVGFIAYRFASNRALPWFGLAFLPAAAYALSALVYWGAFLLLSADVNPFAEGARPMSKADAFDFVRGWGSIGLGFLGVTTMFWVAAWGLQRDKQPAWKRLRVPDFKGSLVEWGVFLIVVLQLGFSFAPMAPEGCTGSACQTLTADPFHAFSQIGVAPAVLLAFASLFVANPAIRRGFSLTAVATSTMLVVAAFPLRSEVYPELQWGVWVVVALGAVGVAAAAFALFLLGAPSPKVDGVTAEAQA